MTKLELSHAYPFVASTFVLVILAGAVFFNEPLNGHKLLGMALIVCGIFVGSQG
jgi:multidrug transporter EmrE-like cation transporter